MVAMIVIPLRASFFSNLTIDIAVNESSPDVGSSKKMILGLVISSYPIEVLFLSPPDIPLTRSVPTIVF
jgi:hypothetical protein